MVLLIFIIITSIVVFFLYRRAKSNEQESIESSEQPSQPMHFDLLDDNGEPIRIIIGDDSNAKVQELQYFCIKDKGYNVSVWPKDYDQFDIVQFSIAGVSYRQNIDKYLGESVGTLEPEPTNPYDQNAIKVLASDGHHVGYVPKDITSEVRRYASLPCPCYFYIGQNSTYFSLCFIIKK